MTHFIAVVHQNGDSKYNLFLPDVDGFQVDDDNMQTLIAKATRDLSAYLENQEIPNARTLLEISSDAEVQGFLKDGANLIVIPLT